MNRQLEFLSIMLIAMLLAFSLSACKENKPKQVCKMTAQEDGTMKNECKPNKQVPDAGVDADGGKALASMSAKGSFVLLELDKPFVLVNREIMVSVHIKTDQGYMSRTKLVVVRSKQHEDAARLILGPTGNIYAFVPKDISKLDRFLASALAKTKRSVSADMSYDFSFKSATDKSIMPRESVLRVWEKVPGQELIRVPTQMTISSSSPSTPVTAPSTLRLK